MVTKGHHFQMIVWVQLYWCIHQTKTHKQVLGHLHISPLSLIQQHNFVSPHSRQQHVFFITRRSITVPGSSLRLQFLLEQTDVTWWNPTWPLAGLRQASQSSSQSNAGTPSHLPLNTPPNASPSSQKEEEENKTEKEKDQPEDKEEEEVEEEDKGGE